MKYVQIQSNVTIQVTKGLQSLNFTKQNDTRDDRLNVKPNWTKTKILIKVGQHLYPAEIKDWPAVKALQKDGLLTIGAETNIGDSEVEKEKARLDAATKETDKKQKESLPETGDVDLDKLAEKSKKEGE